MRYSRDRAEIEALIQEHGLDKCFSQLESYMDHFRVFRAGRREQIFGEADKRQEIYILLSGKVKVCTILSNGRQLLLDYYDKQELFGEYILAEVSMNETNHFYTETLTEVMGLALHVTPVKEQLLNDVKFLRFYIRCLQYRFVQLGNAQPMNVLNSSERNVAGYIWSKLYRQEDYKNTPFYFQENLREVSELLGISYRHLHRVLHKLVEQGILTRTDQGYLVSDVAGLRQIVERE